VKRFWSEAPEPFRTSLARLVAYAEGGPIVFMPPGVSDPAEIAAIVAVAPKPVNVLVSGFTLQLSVSTLAALGVRRISVGSGLAFSAWGAFARAARDIALNGSFEALADGLSFAELNQLFASSGKNADTVDRT
jgi:2-methylisocitrate lyase-like PEP mutase family enzyme